MRVLRVTLEGAANLPVPGRFNRQGVHGHMPDASHPIDHPVSTLAWTKAINRPAASIGFLNPYAVVRHKHQSVRHPESSRRTRASRMNACPKWAEHFDFVLDEGGVLPDRPLLDLEDPTIVIELWSEDEFSTDSHIATVTVPPATVKDLLLRDNGSEPMPSSHPLVDALGLELRGPGSQPALLNLGLGVIEASGVPTASQHAPPSSDQSPLADEQAFRGRLDDDKRLFRERIEEERQLMQRPAEDSNTSAVDFTRIPEDLRDKSSRFFEKLEQSTLWRGRQGDIKAHRHLDVPELPFERFEQRDPKSLLASAGVLEPQLEMLKAFLARVSARDKVGATRAKKKEVWKELRALGVDAVSLAVMFGGTAERDPAVMEHEEYLRMIAREPAMARGIVDELARPKVDLDKLLVEHREASKAVDVLKKFKLIERSYDLHDCNQRVWDEVARTLDRKLQKTERTEIECQADVDPYEGDLYIHYQELAPGEQRLPRASASRPAVDASAGHPLLPGAETRPPSGYKGVRVGQVEGRTHAGFEGPPSAHMWADEKSKVRAAFPRREISAPEGGGLYGLRKQGDTEPPKLLPDSIHSRIRVSTTTLPRPPPGEGNAGDAAAAEAGGETQTETVHQLTQHGMSDECARAHSRLHSSLPLHLMCFLGTLSEVETTSARTHTHTRQHPKASTPLHLSSLSLTTFMGPPVSCTRSQHAASSPAAQLVVHIVKDITRHHGRLQARQLLEPRRLHPMT